MGRISFRQSVLNIAFVSLALIGFASTASAGYWEFVDDQFMSVGGYQFSLVIYVNGARFGGDDYRISYEDQVYLESIHMWIASVACGPFYPGAVDTDEVYAKVYRRFESGDLTWIEVTEIYGVWHP